MIILVLMHTVSAFISVVSIFLGFLISTIYNLYYSSQNTLKTTQGNFSLTIVLFFAIVMFTGGVTYLEVLIAS